jgi:hypothetical protein
LFDKVLLLSQTNFLGGKGISWIKLFVVKAVETTMNAKFDDQDKSKRPGLAKCCLVACASCKFGGTEGQWGFGKLPDLL